MKKIFLCGVFIVVIFTISLAFIGTRPLNTEEVTLLKPIFGSSIDYTKVKIKTGGPLTLVYPGITLGNTISFPKGKYDFENEKFRALFVHEFVHIWQYQNFGLGYIPRSLWELFTQRDTYVIHYDESKNFRDYDVEEQGEIVADYYLTGDSRYERYIEELWR